MVIVTSPESADSPEVLKDISFELRSGERIGVGAFGCNPFAFEPHAATVGRTGAGKSSVALALLRAIKTTGKVYFDGIATDTINLDALRSNIALIPQQPGLIRGTLRENLDPFGQHDDSTLNDALKVAGLFSIRDTHTRAEQEDAGATEETKIGLDTLVDIITSQFSKDM